MTRPGPGPRRAGPRASCPGRGVLLVFFSILAAACEAPPDPLVDPQTVFQRFDWWDNRDWDWYRARIPFFESPEEDLDATYYYRWEVLTKHLVYGSPETGYTFTEFIDRPFWSGTYGAISCPLGHQAYEIRWLKDPRVREDFARYWFETPGAEPRSYSNWYGDAMWATYMATGDSAFLRTVYPHMEAQVEGWRQERWDPEHGMYRWVGAWDGMETNINSRLTDDEFGGAEGYRPTLNSYLYGDLVALSRTAALFGDSAKAGAYEDRAASLKARVQEELWDPDRTFFFHQFARDEKGGIEAKSLTYETGPYAGSPHGRELLGYVPWQFHLPDPGYEAAWRFLMDPDYFWAPYGPTGVEQGDPQFFVSPRCCVWSGNAWPYATTQTLVAMANLLNHYEQDVVDAGDYVRLLMTYARSHRKNGRPYIAEAADPFTGSWAGHNTFYHSEHYLHSGFVDLVITGLVGLRPRADDTLVVHPLVPEDWDYFALDGVEYHGHRVSVIWDRDGTRYGRGAGLVVFVNGEELARRPRVEEVSLPIPSPRPPEPGPRLHNWAVNNEENHFPFASASSSHPLFPPVYAVDGNYWYHPSPPNRWVSRARPRSAPGPRSAGPGAVEGDSARVAQADSGRTGETDSDRTAATDPGRTVEAGPSGSAPEWFQVAFGVERTISRVRLYFLDDENGPPVEAVGEEEASGFPVDPASLPDPPVLPPGRYELLHWDGERWSSIPGQERKPGSPEGRRANTVSFPPLETSRIRVVLEPRPGAVVGLTEVEAWGPGSLPPPPARAPVPNLAWNPGDRPFPRVTASYVREPDLPEQAVDGRVAFTRYSRNRWTAYGSPNPEDWLELDFGDAVEIGGLELFLYGDGRGVAAPVDYRVQVWDAREGGEGKWVQPAIRDRRPKRPTAWAVNVVQLTPTTTKKLRVLFRHPAPAASGLSEIRVFPPTHRGPSSVPGDGFQ